MTLKPGVMIAGYIYKLIFKPFLERYQYQSFKNPKMHTCYLNIAKIVWKTGKERKKREGRQDKENPKKQALNYKKTIQ